MQSMIRGLDIWPDSERFPAFDMFPVTQEFMSPKEFLKRLPEIEEQIESATPVAPVLGKPGFGCIQVTYRRPIYRFLSSILPRKSV